MEKRHLPPLPAPPGASTCQQKELQLLPHLLDPFNFPLLVQPFSTRHVASYEAGTSLCFSPLFLILFLYWAMFGLVPFILDQVSTVKMGAGLMWGVQGGVSISVSWESFVILVSCADAGCLHMGSSEQTRFMCGDHHPRGNMGFSLGTKHGSGSTPVFSNNIAKPMTSLRLSSFLSLFW